jgi:hypothetical protein
MFPMCLHQLLVAASVGALGGREQVRLTPLCGGSVALGILFPILSSPSPFLLLLLFT